MPEVELLPDITHSLRRSDIFVAMAMKTVKPFRRNGINWFPDTVPTERWFRLTSRFYKDFVPMGRVRNVSY